MYCPAKQIKDKMLTRPIDTTYKIVKAMFK